jgi:hypothetical protein
MIEFSCPKCGRHLKIDGSAAGKKGRCKGCNSEIEVPDGNAFLEQLGLLSADESPRDISDILDERESELAENVSQPVNVPSDPTPSKDTTVAHLVKIEKLLEAMVERSQRPKEYKVVIIGNKFLTAQFDPEKIAALLNSHARDGWSVKGMAEFNPPSFTGDARAIIVVMER